MKKKEFQKALSDFNEAISIETRPKSKKSLEFPNYHPSKHLFSLELSFRILMHILI